MSHPSYYTPRIPNGTLLSTNNPKLRKIDTLAILTCLLLLRLSFTPSNYISSNFVESNVGASIELAFYSALHHNTKHHDNVGGRSEKMANPAPIDIDGDGVVDALVVSAYYTRDSVDNNNKSTRSSNNSQKDPSSSSDVDASIWGNGKWGLRILNLKPLHGPMDEMDGVNGPFFEPRTMFASPLQDASSDTASNNERDTREVFPIKLLSIQLPMIRTKLGEEERSRQRHKKADSTSTTTFSGSGYGTNSAIPPKDELNREYDRTRHYFCGRDWHHASSVCHRHCPGGVSTEW